MRPYHSTPFVRPAGSFVPKARTAFWTLTTFFLLVAGVQSLAGNPADVSSVSAGLGPCTADFTVVDSSNKPVFDAKVHIKFKYGFMSKKDTEMEVGTNNDGKAHVEGLPSKLKKPPLEYTIQSGGLTQTVTNDPAADCHPTFNVTLGK